MSLQNELNKALDQINQSETEQNDAEIITKLAALTRLAYDRVRKAEADRLGVRVEVLDREVKAARSDNNDDDNLGLDDVEPYHTPVDLSELLSQISKTVSTFIVCDEGVSDAVALWVAMTWVIDVIEIAPLAVITAPEKRCGKTQLLTILKKLSYRPLAASNISPAALFRCIESWQPTLLLDETDTFLKENEELRGVINSGHSRDNAYVIRTVGDDHTPKRFSTWGAKALSGIGHLPDTLRDRAIILELRRKLSHENVERLRYAEPNLFETLARKLARFAVDYRESIRLARPALPDQLNDRAQDNWEPLLAIADVAGQQWPDRARIAALKLSAIDDSSSVGNELLADIREIFESKNRIKISTADLIKELIEDEEDNWATYNRGKPLTPRQLANKLKVYGVQSETIRFGYQLAKGYKLDQFSDVFNRYLSSTSTFPSVTTLQTKPDNDLSVTYKKSVTVTNPSKRNNEDENVTDRENVTVTQNLSVTLKPAPVLDYNGVTDRHPPLEEKKIEEEKKVEDKKLPSYWKNFTL